MADLLAIDDAAKRLGLSTPWACRLAKLGKLPATQIGRRWFVVDLDAWLVARAQANLEAEPKSPSPRVTRRATEPIAALMPTHRRFGT